MENMSIKNKLVYTLKNYKIKVLISVSYTLTSSHIWFPKSLLRLPHLSYKKIIINMLKLKEINFIFKY